LAWELAPGTPAEKREYIRAQRRLSLEGAQSAVVGFGPRAGRTARGLSIPPAIPAARDLCRQ